MGLCHNIKHGQFACVMNIGTLIAHDFMDGTTGVVTSTLVAKWLSQNSCHIDHDVEQMCRTDVHAGDRYKFIHSNQINIYKGL